MTSVLGDILRALGNLHSGTGWDTGVGAWFKDLADLIDPEGAEQ